MKIFLKILQVTLIVFGALFIVEVIFIAWLWFADPLGIRPMLFETSESPAPTAQLESSPNGSTPPPATAPAPSPAPAPDSKFNVTPEQQATAESMGFDLETLVSDLTPEQEDCLRTAVGETRAAEIEAGAMPSAFEILKAQRCL